MSVNEAPAQGDMSCPECGEIVAASATWTEQYGALTVRGCPSCECVSEVVKWINAGVEDASQ